MYEIRETLTSKNSIDNITKYDVVVEMQSAATEQYKYRKYINGMASEPAEYAKNDKVYEGITIKRSRILKDSEYSLKLTEKEEVSNE